MFPHFPLSISKCNVCHVKSVLSAWQFCLIVLFKRCSAGCCMLVTQSLVKIAERFREPVGIVFMANASLSGDSIYASLASPENKHSFAFTAIGKRQTFTLHKVMKISFYLFTSLALYSAITKRAISRPTKFQKRFCKMAFGRMLSICLKHEYHPLENTLMSSYAPHLL